MVEVTENALVAILGELRSIAASNAAITQQNQAIRDANAANAAAIIGRLSDLERAVYCHPPQHSASGGDDAVACASTMPSLFARPHSYAPVPDLSALPSGGHDRFADGEQSPQSASLSVVP
jgi:hypothetical protein